MHLFGLLASVSILYTLSGRNKDAFDERRGLISGREPFAYLANWEDRQICMIAG
jgi:hypothetical protein